MTIRSMSRLMSTGHGEKDTFEKGLTAAARKPVHKSLGSAIETIVTFIPTEVIGIYIAGSGILMPKSPAPKWSIFGVCVLLIPVFVILSAVEERKAGSKLPIYRAFWLVLFAEIAFVAWTSALPSTPFEQLNASANQIGGLCAVILSLLMPRIAKLLGILA